MMPDASSASVGTSVCLNSCSLESMKKKASRGNRLHSKFLRGFTVCLLFSSERTERAVSVKGASRWFLLAAFITAFGSAMANLATAFVTYGDSRSVITVVVVATAQTAPIVLLAPIAIRLVPRFGAARTFGISSFVLGIAALVVAIVTAMGRLSVTTLFLWSLTTGIIVGLTSPALPMFIWELAPEGKVAEYNAMVFRSRSIAVLLGLVVGGIVLSGLGPAWIFGLDALSFGATTLIGITQSEKRKVKENRPPSMSEGMNVISRMPNLRAVFLTCAALMVFIGPLGYLLPAIALEISPRPELLSLYQAAIILGGVAVVFFVRTLHKRFQWSYVTRGCCAIPAGGLIWLSLIQSSAHNGVFIVGLTFLTLLSIGLAYNIEFSVLSSIVQTGTPENYRSSIFACWSIVIGLIAPIGGFAVGAIAQNVTVGWALFFVGVGMLLLATFGKSLDLFLPLDAEGDFAEP
jgi:MFS family permease